MQPLPFHVKDESNRGQWSTGPVPSVRRNVRFEREALSSNIAMISCPGFSLRWSNFVESTTVAFQQSKGHQHMGRVRGWTIFSLKSRAWTLQEVPEELPPPFKYYNLSSVLSWSQWRKTVVITLVASPILDHNEILYQFPTKLQNNQCKQHDGIINNWYTYCQNSASGEKYYI